MKKVERVFKFNDNTQIVLGAMRLCKNPDIRFFISMIEEYNNISYFQPVLTTPSKTIYEGSVPQKLICGDPQGVMIYFVGESSEYISIQGKDNPINSYTLRISTPALKATLEFQSEKIRKEIKFDVYKSLFNGKLIHNITTRLERFEEPWC